MEGFSPEVFTATLALIGCVIVIAALFSGLIERSGMPQVAVFLAMGAMLGPMGLGLLDIRLDSPILRTVATLSLVLVLFTDAVSLSMAEVRRHGLLAFLVLGPGTLLSAALIALAAWWLLDLTPAGAAILGAALASTDPVLLRGLLRGHDLPPTVRQALRLESGLNDAVLLPVVLAAMLILSQGSSLNISHWTQLGIDLFLLGPSAGVAVGLLSVASLDLVRRRIGVRRDYESLYSLGVVFAAYAAAEAVHGSGFLAAFTAGLTIAALDVELCDCFLEYGETTAEMALLFTFVLFGSSLIWQGLTIINGHTLLFAVIVLLIRPVVFLASLAGTSLDYHGRLLIAWFGPRGLSSLLLVLLPVFAGVPGGAQLFSLCCLVVLLSIVLHGGSLMLLNHRAIAAKAGQAETPFSTLTADSPAETLTNSLPSPGQTSSAAPNSADNMTVAELRQLQQAGVPIIPLDVRTDRSYASSGLVLQGAQRLSPDNPVNEATQLNLPRDAWLAAFCACPNEETSGRVAQELRHAGWPQARALVGGWQALQDGGFVLQPPAN